MSTRLFRQSQLHGLVNIIEIFMINPPFIFTGKRCAWILFCQIVHNLLIVGFPVVLSWAMDQISIQWQWPLFLILFMVCTMLMRIYYQRYTKKLKEEYRVEMGKKLLEKSFRAKSTISISTLLNNSAQQLVRFIPEGSNSIILFFMSTSKLYSLLGQRTIQVLILLSFLSLVTWVSSKGIEKQQKMVNQMIVKKNVVIGHFLDNLREYKLCSLVDWFIRKIGLLRKIEFGSIKKSRWIYIFQNFINKNSNFIITIIILLLFIDIDQRPHVARDINYFIVFQVKLFSQLPSIISGLLVATSDYQLILTALAANDRQEPHFQKDTAFVHYVGKVRDCDGERTDIDIQLEGGKVYHVAGESQDVTLQAIGLNIELDGTIHSCLENPKIIYEVKQPYIYSSFQQNFQSSHPEEVLDYMKKLQCTYLTKRTNLNVCSGGEKSRLAIVRALSHRPQVLVLNETLSSINYRIRSNIMLVLEEYSRQHGACVVVSGTGKGYNILATKNQQKMTFSNYPVYEQTSLPELDLEQKHNLSSQIKEQTLDNWQLFLSFVSLLGGWTRLIITCLVILSSHMIMSFYYNVITLHDHISDPLLYFLVTTICTLVFMRCLLFISGTLTVCQKVHQNTIGKLGTATILNKSDQGRAYNVTVHCPRQFDTTIPAGLQLMTNNISGFFSIFINILLRLSGTQLFFLFSSFLLSFSKLISNFSLIKRQKQQQITYKEDLQAISLELIEARTTIRQYQHTERLCQRFIPALENNAKKSFEVDHTIINTVLWNMISSIIFQMISLVMLYRQVSQQDIKEYRALSYRMSALVEYFGLFCFNIINITALSKNLQLYQKFQRQCQSHHKVVQIKADHQQVLSLTIQEFHHPNQPSLFENTGLQVFRGDKIAIVGQTGIGKSTLLSIIAGMYERPAVSYISTYGFASQRNLIIPGSREENVNPEQVSEEVSLIEGSEMQLQKIALQRALKRCKGGLLLLDEPRMMPKEGFESVLIITHNKDVIPTGCKMLTIKDKRIVGIDLEQME